VDFKKREKISLDQISEFVSDYIAQMTETKVDISQVENFYENGLLDSFSLMNLIITVEKKYDVKFRIDEIADESFRTVSGISRVIFGRYVG
jgi:acyl carrier protein